MNSKMLFNTFINKLVAAGADARVARSIASVYNVIKSPRQLTDAEFAEMNRGLDTFVEQYKQKKNSIK